MCLRFVVVVRVIVEIATLFSWGPLTALLKLVERVMEIRVSARDALKEIQETRNQSAISIRLMIVGEGEAAWRTRRVQRYPAIVV